MGTSSSKSKSERYPVPPPGGSYLPPPPQSRAGAPGTFAAFASPTLKFRAIADKYQTLDQVTDALRRGGLESSNLIVAVDFTKSNEWTGKVSFQGRSLHAIGDVASPYEEAISVIGRTLSAFDDDGLIPCYGFGDATTGDKSVFSFLAGDKPCQGLEQALWRYRELCPYVRMAGPTSFAPAIRQACSIVEASGGQYHILLLVADGQVSRSSDLPKGRFSEQEQETIDAIVEASFLPLSIIMVGVGDGPWDLMKDFDDALPQREFDNFQFVNFTDIMNSTGMDRQRRETVFALRALMEVPEQYSAIQKAGIMGSSSTAAANRSRSRRRRGNPPLDPPVPQHMLTGSGGPGPTGCGASASCSGGHGGGGLPPRPPSSGPGPARNKTMSADGSRPTGGAGASGAAAQTRNSYSGGTPADPAPAAGAQPDPMYLCPITQDLMTDPVIATDGYTYERAAITDWLKRKSVSPLTNQPMPGGAVLIPNHGLRSAIMEWKQRNGR
ncbi:hypothetical protein HYH03_006397 [Edaphochlamys debaryana]|uniref:U-box domain-containing protein n=1 Tax=Edaphochlamys debaryana TaxID=47281 RepID=A0A835Y3U0_9CHLO|nr:hypothetical protein HYH03_006397 [Edaphochlamys debaryana]|eukprot:KAG2495451.1 hypothetical protein HYH03_006397 [Edaphochlamys debaryana]